SRALADAPAAPKASGKEIPQQRAPDKREQLLKRKLSYKEQRELEQLPANIDALEAEQRAIREELADGSLYTRDGSRAAALHARDAQIEDLLMQALERWSALST
ncbi:MAG: ABC transporter ATP-binding protein, partial [Gallionellaceae bacterium]|nr:ABC transporter ATP-binding protein [Gallionellaceae bacterium]